MTDAPGIRRGRVFVRRLGRTTSDWRSTSSRPDGFGYGMVGVVEVDDAAPWRRERSYSFACLASGSNANLSFSGESVAPEYQEDVVYSEISSFLKSMMFPRASEVHEALGWGAGGMVLRDTRGPSCPGTTLATIAIAMCLPEPFLPDAHMASFEVHGQESPGSAKLLIEGPCLLTTNGVNIEQVLKMPLWGWEDEPFGFSSTMRLDAIDRCTKVQDAMIAGGLSPKESHRLRASVQHTVQDDSDPVFAAFRRRAAAEGMVRPWDATLTASEMISKNEAVDMLVKELLAMDRTELAA